MSCEELGVEVFCSAVELVLPGRGICMGIIVHNPASGALQQIFQPIPSN